ncbi:Mlf3p KNAG_0M01980 [Huiozyma naganishii CBS 8797]|uniref:Uncharacterized protein n=1 Tax=Huiozyma naganishii (strain ATCC MYA-139 / BCRC 22969 / CBS 8797 / KCTC 17520 / NBRC 10181 / NCYC 3082 / Yp74L-3) TaxID=1071383 RepID=J7SBH6_HUIN7|nr:hypothetical protein KNAG_0M01980 [Kazachstania naganishii CBS 8797]CCK73051.1 hypothetical protein KNAG_0M01980 [Kazachstania naganishii CBS 8797]
MSRFECATPSQDDRLQFNMTQPPSPTLSERSLIFERDVQEGSSFLPIAANATEGNSTATSASITNLNGLSKQRSYSQSIPITRSNSAAYVPGFISRLADWGVPRSLEPLMTSPTAPPLAPTPVVLNRRLSRTNSHSSSNVLCQGGSVLLSNSLSTPGLNNHVHHNRRRTLENMVAPALDASCSLLADESTDLENVDVVHSRSSSVIGLDMALGYMRSNPRSRNNSNIPASSVAPNYKPTGNDHTVEDSNGKTLNFYSYAALRTDEMTSGNSQIASRPGSVSSHCSTGCKPSHSPNIFQQQQFKTGGTADGPGSPVLNPFLGRRESSPYLSLSPPQNCRRLSNTNHINGGAKTPTSPLNGNQFSILSSNMASVLLQDSSKHAPLKKPNRLRNNSLGVEKFGGKLGQLSRFHIESDNDDALSDADIDVPDRAHSCIQEGIISTAPLSKKRTGSTNTTIPLLASPYEGQTIHTPVGRTVTFLDRKNGSASVIQLQPTPVSYGVENQLQTEKLGDVLRRRLSESRPE